MCVMAGVQDHEGLAFGTNDESKIGPSQFASASLYVGDLDLNVTDSQLHDLFNRLAQVVYVRVCWDSTTHRSLVMVMLIIVTLKMVCCLDLLYLC